ncbi:MAG TPA: hypothetical protein VKA57_08400 [Solirubrobacteraceae bacterium]|nr:hypothetical protein [Solirubrobacteraceae bacterium]
MSALIDTLLPSCVALRCLARSGRVVGPGSALIRRDVLRATRRRAERA